MVIGGGPTGVEIAGAIAENIRYAVTRYYPPGLAAACTVYLVERTPTLLALFTVKSQRYARERLAQIGVELRLGVAVSRISGDGVTLAEGTVIPRRLAALLWAP